MSPSATPSQQRLYTVEFLVRDYELDQYGVVNNSVYLNYLEHARHDFLVSVGIDPAEVAREGRALALSEIRVSFKQPLVSRDRFRVTVTIDALKGARAVMGQQILREPDGALMLEATATAVFLDEAGRPTRVPEHVRQAFAPYVPRD